MLLRGVLALVILIAAYWVWALAGAAQLASAAGPRHSGRRARARSRRKTLIARWLHGQLNYAD
jgi:hypothetical protein